MGTLYKRVWSALPDDFAGCRQLGVVVTIFLLTVCHPAMMITLGLSALLGIIWMIRARKTIPWHHLWPLGLPVLFFVLILTNIPRSPSPTAMHAIDRNLPWALVPLMFVGLKPNRLWGRAWVWGTVIAFTTMLIKSTLHFIYYRLDFKSTFCYEDLTYNLGVGSLFFCVCCAVSLVLCAEHLLQREPWKAKWGHLLLSLYMLGGIILSLNRSGILALCVMAVVLVIMLLHSKRVGRAVIFGVTGIALVGVVMLVVIVLQLRGGTAIHNPRLSMWRYTLTEQAAYMPWGLGTESQSDFIAQELYTKHRDCPDFQEMTLGKFNNTHSSYLDSLVQYGIVGLAYFLLLLAVPWFGQQAYRKRHRLLLVLVFVALFFNSVYQSSEFVRLFALLLNIPLAYMVAYKQCPETEQAQAFTEVRR